MRALVADAMAANWRTPPSSKEPTHEAPLSGLQPLGRALMLPIAVLPVAGLLLRLGQPGSCSDICPSPAPGGRRTPIFHNLGLLFAIGVAVGFARDEQRRGGPGGRGLLSWWPPTAPRP